MSSEERGQWVYLVAIGLTYAAYVAIVFAASNSDADN